MILKIQWYMKITEHDHFIYHCYCHFSVFFIYSYRMLTFQCKHPIKYTITKAAIPIVGYAAFVIYSHYFFHLCGSSCSSSSYVAFCIYGILAITSFKYSLGFTSCVLQVASSEHTTLILTAAS